MSDPIPTDGPTYGLDAVYRSLEDMMDWTAQAMYDDGEVNFDGCGVNSFEACSVLNDIANLFGFRSVTERYNAICAAGGYED